MRSAISLTEFVLYSVRRPLSLLRMKIGAARLVDRAIGEQVDPQPRRTAWHQHEREPVIIGRDFCEHRLELSLQ